MEEMNSLIIEPIKQCIILFAFHHRHREYRRLVFGLSAEGPVNFTGGDFRQTKDTLFYQMDFWPKAVDSSGDVATTK